MIWRIAAIVVFLGIMTAGLVAYQSPHTFFDEIDPGDVNVSFQKFSEWITRNDLRLDTLEVERDTLHSRVDTVQVDIDTLAADIDTLYAEIDTLHARVDSNDTEIAALETARDSVFFAYNPNQFDVSAASTQRVSIPTEILKAGIYSHTDSSSVACNSAGYYCVDFALSLDKPTTATASASIQKYSSGWSVIPGSNAYTEGADYKSLAGCVLVQLVSGDSVALAVTNGAAGDDLPVIASSARMRIMKIH